MRQATRVGLGHGVPGGRHRGRALPEARLARRRPDLYVPLLALHRSPTDGNATTSVRSVALSAAQWPDGPSLLSSARPEAGELLVLPELSALPSGLSAADIKAKAEAREGAFEQALSAAAKAGSGFVVNIEPSSAPGTTTVLYVPQSAPQAESRYVVKRVPDGTIQVDWIRVGTVGGLDWLDVQARQRATRCGGIS